MRSDAVGSKADFTCAAIAIAIAVLFMNPKANNAGPDWFWRGGKGDWIRNTICRPDGSLRSYTKFAVLIWFAVVLAALWLVT